MNDISRRELLTVSATTAMAALAPAASTQAAMPDKTPRVRYCLNTSTLRGAKLSLPELIQIASAAGYDGIEPWISEINAFRDQGGDFRDLRKQIKDAGLTVESAIGFAQWIIDDNQQRKAGLEAARRDMELVKAIGGSRIAAPPSGATQTHLSDLDAIAERYAELVRAGASIGVVPELEVWGFSKTLSRLCETLYVLAACGEPSGCLLPDVYHLYKGDSPFEGLRLLSGAAVPVFHMNDYPGGISREDINDADRVYPGDGIAPLDEILGMLITNGFTGTLSLELFNRDYWKQPPEEVARRGLASMRKAVERINPFNPFTP